MSQYQNPNNSKKRVLVADDEQHIVSILRIALEAEGFEVFSAADGEEAMTVFGEKMPDIVILDIMLPKVDGWQVLSFIKASKNKCPVVMLSAKDTFSDVDKSLNAGADAHLFKPFDIGRVLGKLKQLLK